MIKLLLGVTSSHICIVHIPDICQKYSPRGDRGGKNLKKSNSKALKYLSDHTVSLKEVKQLQNCYSVTVFCDRITVLELLQLLEIYSALNASICFYIFTVYSPRATISTSRGLTH
jgi:hypothetical protein